MDTLEDATLFAEAQVLALPDDPADVGVAPAELRQLEVVLHAAVKIADTARLDPEDRALLQAAVDTLRIQLVSPVPDRQIVGRVLRRILATGGALFVGVAGNYLTDLVRHFHVPWP